MTAAFAFLLFATATSAEPPAGAGPQPARAPARAVEILIAGPQPGRRAMREALEAALEPDSNLSWSEQDTLPDEASWRLPTDEGTAQKIWVDVANPARVRIFLPACQPVASATVRTIDAPAAGAAGWQPVARESAAQVVRSAVQILTGDAVDLSPPAVARAPSQEAVSSVPPPAADVARRSEIPAPASNGSSQASRGRIGAAVAWGLHTSPFLLSEPHTQSHWLGLSVQLSARWETPKVLLAIRSAWEPSERSVDSVELRSQLYSATFSGSWKLNFGQLALSLGAELGGIVIRQEASLIPDPSTDPSLTHFTVPGQLGRTWSSGLVFGPIAEGRVVISPHWFLHAGVGRPIAFMRINDSGDTSWRFNSYLRLMGGFGATL